MTLSFLAAQTSPLPFKTVSEPVRGLGPVAAVDYHCNISASGKIWRLVLRESGPQALSNGRPQEMNSLPILQFTHFSVIEDESGRFSKLRHVRGNRFAGKDGDVALVNDKSMPQALIRIDYLYVDQKDRAIILYLPDPKVPNTITTEAGTCTLSRAEPSQGAEVKTKQ
jgi:hypothetical protein